MAEFVEAGEPPIVFAPGAINLQAGRFFQTATDVCRQHSLRAVFLTKHPELLPPDLPPGVRHFGYIPFGALLPRVSVVVHHGGTGTTSQCLAAGVPQIVTPAIHIHFDTALRLERLGVGTSLKPKGLKPARLWEAIEHLRTSTDVATRCRETAARFDNVDPKQKICDLLEGLVGTKHPESYGEET